MILLNWGWSMYVVSFFVTFFLIIVDVILTNINARLQYNYYKVEVLPWIRFAYNKRPPTVGLFISLFFNLLIFVAFFFLPVRITWIGVLLGFFLYRVVHSLVRLLYMRKMRREIHGQGK